MSSEKPQAPDDRRPVSGPELLLSLLFTKNSVDMNQCHTPSHSLSLPVEERNSFCTPPPSSPPLGVLKDLPVMFQSRLHLMMNNSIQ